jgi:hypothetical protein
VDGGDCAALPVGQKNRQTVRGLDDEEKSGFLRDQGIPRRADGRRLVDDMDDLGVDLVEKNGLKTPVTGERPEGVLGKFARPESVDEAGDSP